MASTGKGIGGHQSPRAVTVEWVTPQFVINRLGGWQSFDRDPCAVIGQPWPCARESYTRLDDGLAKPWGNGAFYMNPPYGDEVEIWLDRASQHGNGIALIFARTETDAFHQYVWARATAVLFLRGRLHFHFGVPFADKKGNTFQIGDRAPHNAGGPSVLIAYGQRQAERLASCGIPGWFGEIRNGRVIT